MELIIIVVIAFLIGKGFGSRKRGRRNDWPDEPVVYAPPQKKKGCLVRMLSLVLCGYVLLSVGSALFLAGDAVSSTRQQPSAQENHLPTVVSTPIPTAEPTATPEPETLQEWAETIAQRVYGRFDYEYTNLISVSCYQVDGDPAPMVEIYAKYPAAFLLDNDERMSNFLYNAKRVTEQLDELAKAGKIEYGSVLIHGRTGFIDKYGTESEGDAAQIRIKAKEAAKVTNWDNILSDYLPELAVSFGIHTAIRDGLTYEYLSKIR